MPINWENFDNKIKEIKFPLVLIFKFFNCLHKINDTYASIMLRYLIKNNIDIFLNNPFYLLIQQIPKKIYPETTDILYSFYDFQNKKKFFLNLIRKWKEAYQKKDFWNKEINLQIIELNKIKSLIQSIFDNSRGGISFILKMGTILKEDNNDIKLNFIDLAIDRLRQVYKIMGAKFFILSKIPLITIDEFSHMDETSMINYMNVVYFKTIEMINTTINIFEEFNMINLRFYNLINPFLIDIEDDFSDGEVEDIEGVF
jgi:hypothetical protein